MVLVQDWRIGSGPGQLVPCMSVIVLLHAKFNLLARPFEMGIDDAEPAATAQIEWAVAVALD